MVQKPITESLRLPQGTTDSERVGEYWIDSPLEDQGSTISYVGYRGATAGDWLPRMNRVYRARIGCITGSSAVGVRFQIHLADNQHITGSAVNTTCTLYTRDGSYIADVSNQPEYSCPKNPQKVGDWWDFGTRQIPANRQLVIEFALNPIGQSRGYPISLKVTANGSGKPNVDVPLWVYSNFTTTPNPANFTGEWEGEVEVTARPKGGPALHETAPMIVEIMQSGSQAFIAGYHGFHQTDAWPPDFPYARTVAGVTRESNGSYWLRAVKVPTYPYGIVYQDWQLSAGAFTVPDALYVSCRSYLDPSLDYIVTGSLYRR